MAKSRRAFFPHKRRFISRIFSGWRAGGRLMGNQRLLVLGYHRIKKNADFSTEFDDGVFGPTQDEFRKQISVIKRESAVLSEDDLLFFLRSGRSLPDRSVLVTFDDGYRDNYDLALPVLRAQRIPAIFFIPTQAIEERFLGWWDLVSYALKKTSKTEILIAGRKVQITGNRGALIGAILYRVSRMPNPVFLKTVSEIFSACEVEMPTRSQCDRELMTWDEIRECRDSGITIGSHAYSHQVLSNLSLAEQESELRLSREMLRFRLGSATRSLAYPVGTFEHFGLETMALAKTTGYDLAFSFNTGLNPTKPDPWNIRRISVPEDLSILKATLTARLFYTKRSYYRREPSPLRALLLSQAELSE